MSGSFSAPKVAAIVLAAGSSSRMTDIKQNLPWKGTTLLGHIINVLKQSEAQDIYVVLGAYKEKLTDLNNNSITAVIDNKKWNLGMGGSIAKAIDYISKKGLEYDGYLIALVDQPLIELKHYNKLINSCIDYNRIIASYYNDGVGVPAVFGKNHTKELLLLNKDIGAKKIIKNNMAHLIKLDAPMAKYDLDTKDDYEKFYQTHGRI